MDGDRQQPLYAGIDVGLDELFLACPQNDTFAVLNFPRTVKGIREIRSLLLKLGGPVQVCLEPTSTYHLLVLDELYGQGQLTLHLPNPGAVRSHSKAKMGRGKTDRQDCVRLAEFCRETKPRVWHPPAQAAEELRNIMRRVDDLSRRHAALLCKEASEQQGRAVPVVLRDIRSELKSVEKRMEKLRAKAMQLLQQKPELGRQRELIDSIPGFAVQSSLEILSELAMLPADLGKKQWIAAAGLDPESEESGKTRKKPQISRKGNKRLRKSLTMPALSALRCCDPIRQFHQRLKDRGITGRKALVAVMRKLLQIIWGVLHYDCPFDPTKVSPKTT